MKAGLYSYPLTAGRAITIKEGGGDFKKATFNEKGEMLAFLYVDKAEKDSTKEKNNYALFLSQQGNSANLIVKAEDKVVPEGWIISPEGEIVFSKDGEYLFFPTSPEPRQQDTTVLAENRPDVQIWNWNETVQYTQQHVDRKKEAKKTYKAVYNISSAKSHLLNTLEFPELQIPEEGNFALISTSEPYGAERMWRGKSRQDIYAANMRTGERVPLVKAFDGRMSFSPSGKYVFWYQEADSAWFTCELSSQKFYKVSSPETFEAWDKNNDVPDYPKAYGAAGWSENDQYLLLYDQHDIWKFSPTNSEKPVNLTGKGKKTEAIRYRFQRLDKEQRSIDLKATQFLVGFNEKTKTSGFYSTKFDRPTSPKALLTGDFKANFAGKAKNAEVLLYTTEGFSNYPEIRIADLRFKKNRQLTNLGNQQDGFLWGTAELTSWISLDGDTLEGVIYKPANFDPQKKYPLIVNFYERNSDNMFSYRMPEPGRSTIDYHFYNSNGYIIFNPDVRYKVGHPGESCFNCVIPGIESLIAKGYIDEKAIGAQGHSWGGYQVAYLATRTSLFAAIESGAPVVNMFSAYGGIRWGTGLNRSFQYEHGQSRIGATPWENPLLYKENSPLFTMDKVSTPILILHNDADGHVPWYQGIEYFIALKRLQKPVWLLNYPGEPHWPTKMPNRIDFQLRMFQFFEHYLKKVPAPFH
jgi:dipeptidyl aminopeptidase/acylaminoacyl peptidase